jgi:hypothetical protein
MTIQQQIKEVLVNLAVEDALPLDFNQLDESLFDSVVNPIVNVLETIRTDAGMALDGTWDHCTNEGKEGFESQIILIERILTQQR